VLAAEKQIEVFREPSKGQFMKHQINGPGGVLKCAALPKLNLKLDELFVKRR
jgi:hypothetical protein